VSGENAKGGPSYCERAFRTSPGLGGVPGQNPFSARGMRSGEGSTPPTDYVNFYRVLQASISCDLDRRKHLGNHCERNVANHDEQRYATHEHHHVAEPRGGFIRNG
jgi:hypothetical protein